MDWLVNLLTDTNSIAHILVVYALVISVGMLLGQIKIFGISLGVTFILFVGLACGYAGFTVNSTVLSFVRDFGLILFVFFIGLQVGPSFFSSFKSGGLKLNLLTLLTVILSLAVTIILFFVLQSKVSLPTMLGVYFGAVTNTPGLGATQEALKVLNYTGEDIAVAYACAYPLGVAATIGTAIALRIIFKINLKEEDKQWEDAQKANSDAPIFFHAAITNPALEGRTIRQVRDFVGRPFICSRVLHNGEITSPSAETVLHTGDILRIVSAEENKESVVAFCGKEDKEVDLVTESSPIISRTIRVTKPEVNGLTVHDLHLSKYDGINITRIFRAGLTLFPYNNLHLQLGDRVYCVGPERAVARLADTLGNQEKKLYHPNLVSIFLGIVIGIIFGSLPIAIPGMPVPLKLGLAGGPLIVAILLGYYGPNLRLITYTTESANLMLREIGIALFLASVGLNAGKPFVEALGNGEGLLYAGLGLFITIIPLVIVGSIARKKYSMNYHSIVGMLAGATTDPPTLAYAGTLSEKNSSVIAYSTVYPLAMFLRILSGQFVLLILWQYV